MYVIDKKNSNDTIDLHLNQTDELIKKCCQSEIPYNIIFFSVDFYRVAIPKIKPNSVETK